MITSPTMETSGGKDKGAKLVKNQTSRKTAENTKHDIF